VVAGVALPSLLARARHRQAQDDRRFMVAAEPGNAQQRTRPGGAFQRRAPAQRSQQKQEYEWSEDGGSQVMRPLRIAIETHGGE